APPRHATYARGWFEDASARWAAGTVYDRRRVLEGRLIPYFGERVVSEIDRDDVDAFVARLARGIEKSRTTRGDTTTTPAVQPSNRRMHIILDVLRLSPDRAVRRGWLPDNPARQVNKLREEKPEIAPLSFDDIRALFAKGLRTDDERRYFTVALFTGMRPGEQMGLRWEDVDWVRRTLGVRRTVGRFGAGVTKTVASRRDVAMLPNV